MKYEVTHNQEKHRFEMQKDGYLAWVEYQIPDKTIMNIYRTEVPKVIERQGVASAIMQETLAYARRNHYRIITTCGFAHSYLMKHPDCGDILK